MARVAISLGTPRPVSGYLNDAIRTAEGKIPIRVPQVRDAGEPFRSTLMGFLERNSEVLDRLVMEMYAGGWRPETSRTPFLMSPGSW